MMHTETYPETTPARRRNKKVLIGGVALALVLAGGAALAGAGRPWRGGEFMGAGILRLTGDLDLTEQQEVQLVRIRRNMREQARQLHKDIRAPLSQALDEIEKPRPDAAKLHSIADDMIKRVGGMAHAAIDQFLSLHATFSNEQRETLVQRGRMVLEHRFAHDGERERDIGGKRKAPAGQ